MKIETGNMWDIRDETDLFLFTSNGVVQRGQLAMGGGMAKQMLQNVSTKLPKALGRAIFRESGLTIDLDGNYDGVYDYGLLVSQNWPEVKWGAFQTKLNYRDDTPLDLVQRATSLLHQWCDEHPDARVDCNFPGIGLGRQTYGTILPIIQSLPDNVHFWTYDKWSDRDHYRNMPLEFYRSVENICGDVDPDAFLMRPDELEVDSIQWEYMDEQRGMFSYMFKEDGEMLIMAHTDSYKNELHPDAVLYKTFEDRMACAIIIDETHWVIRSLEKTEGSVIWSPPPPHMQSEEDYLEVFPQFERKEYEYGI
jgi:hypothetical protein